MNLARYLTEDRIDLALDESFPREVAEWEQAHASGQDDQDDGEDDEEDTPAAAAPEYETLVLHMARLLETSSDVVNPTRLRREFVHRERRAPSLLGGGVALPHVRTLQARRLIMAVAVSTVGLPVATPDDEPLRLVGALVGPPYDDKAYLQVYKALGEKLLRPGFVEVVLGSRRAGEVLRALAGP